MTKFAHNPKDWGDGISFETAALLAVCERMEAILTELQAIRYDMKHKDQPVRVQLPD